MHPVISHPSFPNTNTVIVNIPIFNEYICIKYAIDLCFILSNKKMLHVSDFFYEIKENVSAFLFNKKVTPNIYLR